MRPSINSVAVLILVSVFAAGMAGCDQKEPAPGAEGPAEKAGQKIDQAASKASVHLNRIAEKAGQGLQQAGEKLEDAAKDAQKKE